MWIQKMSRKVMFLSLPVVASAFLFSCSGGGGGGEAPQINSSSVSGSVDTNGTSTASLPEGVTALVKIVSIDSKGNEIDSKVQTTTSGFFAINVNTSNNGGKLVITASANGYTEGTKTIDYNSPDELKELSIKLKIDPITQKIIPVSQINITSSNGKVLRVGFFRDSNGIMKAVSGDSDIKKASEGNRLVMELAIPVSKLAEGTQNIKVSYKDFKPSDPNDYENFPGEETNDGKELISIGFDWLEITDPETGKNPFVKAQEPSAQGISAQLAKVDLGEYYRLLRYVDCEQINKIRDTLGTLDEDTAKPGIQFTFYAFDWDVGAWVPAGQATFVDSDDSNLVKYYEIGENDDTVDTAWDYIIQNGCISDTPCDPANPTSTACVDVNGDGNMEDVSCSGNHVITDEINVCSEDNQGNYSPTYVVISVTNPELNWKNLDYVKPGTGIVECKITITDDKNNPISTNVQAYADSNECIEWTSGITAANTGEATLSTLKYCDPANGIIEYFDPINNMSVQYDSDNDGTPDSVTFCPPNDQNCTCEINITIEDINKCTVEGYIKDEDSNTGKSDVPVIVNNDTYTVYRWGYTDTNGKYSIKVPCGMELHLNADSTILDFNVNGNIEDDEVSDVQNIATLKDIKSPNNPPAGYAWLSAYSTKKGNSVVAYLYAWDFENDVPIKYKLKVLDSSNQEVLSNTGTVANNYGQISETIDTSSLSAGNYTIKFMIADSGYTGDISAASQQVVEITAGVLTVYEGNAAPVISYYYLNPSIVSHVSSTINVYGAAYDLDGDSLGTILVYVCYDENNNFVMSGDTGKGNELLNNNFTTWTIPSNTDIKRCELKWKVWDDQSTDFNNPIMQVRNVYIQNHSPIVSIWTDNQVVPGDTESVTIESNIIEPDDDDYTCTWIVNGTPTDETDCEEFTLDLENYSPPTEIEVELVVTDSYGNSGSSSLTIFFGQQGNLDINIQ